MISVKEQENQHLILFDGICNLCNRTVQFIIKHDPEARFRFAALQNYQERSFLQLDQAVNNQTESVVYIRDGQIFSASSAVLEIIKELGWPWKSLYISKIIPKRIIGIEVVVFKTALFFFMRTSFLFNGNEKPTAFKRQ